MNITLQSLRSTIAFSLLSFFVLTPYYSHAAQLEEIIVTAQKKEQSLQAVPIAINAFSENFLEQTGITTTQELQMITPGLHFSTQLAAATPFIRGIGNSGTTVGQDASVATFVDGVYMSSSAGSILSLNNVERIEVLKGPQGTLFGRNATGGLVHVITKTPEHETAANLELGYGNFDTTKIGFYGTTGITERIAADISIIHNNQDEGWGTNLATGNDISTSEETSVRTKWLFEVSDDTSITFSADYTDIESSKVLAQTFWDGSLGLDGQLVYGALLGAGLTPAQAAPLAAQAATSSPDHFWDINTAVDPLDMMENWGMQVKVVHQLENDMELTSITAYRDFEHEYVFEQFTTPFNLLLVKLPEYTQTFTQELRLAGSTDKLEWIVGAFFLDEDAGFGLNGQGFSASGPLFGPNALHVLSEQSTFSWSLFAQGNYAISDATNLTLGLRYTEDKRELTADPSALFMGTPVLTTHFEDEETFSEPTWRISLDHQFSDNLMGYVSYNRGFKSGVYSTVVTDVIGGPRPPVDPEILDAFEVGFKSDLMGDRLRLNGALFYYEFDNLQATVSEAGSAYLINAAEATISGGELELVAIVNDYLSIHSGISIIDAEYDSFKDAEVFLPTGIGGNTKVVIDASGNKLPHAPESTINLGVTYENGPINASVNYFHTDGFFWEADNRVEQPSYSVINSQIKWTNAADSMYVQLYVNNLGDEEYADFLISAEGGDQYIAAPPRTYGVKLGFNF